MLPRVSFKVRPGDYFLNCCTNRKSKATLWSRPSICLLGPVFGAKFWSICPGEFFKVLEGPKFFEKEASKKIFKLKFSACGASKNFLNKLPDILLTHHFDIWAKKIFSKNFQIFKKFLYSVEYFLKITFSKNGLWFDTVLNLYSKWNFQGFGNFKKFYLINFFSKFIFLKSEKKFSWTNTLEFGVENVPQ